MFDCYKGKTVLVTGNTGFKGAWLTYWLLKLGAKVIGLSIDIPTKPSLFETLNLAEQIDHLWVDIRDADAVKRLVAQTQPDVVFHLAAQPLVHQAYQAPGETFSTNVMGMVNILDSIRAVDCVSAAVLITSDKCYENVEWEYGYREIDRLGGKDSYSASKGCAELVAHAYWHSYFSDGNHTPFVTTRAGNVIGGGDWAANRLVPDTVMSWSAGNKLVIRSPHATRPWQHVLEPLSGYLTVGAHLLAQPILGGQAFNFGPHEGTMQTVGAVVEAMAAHWPEAQWHTEPRDDLKEASLLKLDCSKAAHLLQWQATLGFKDTIAMTAQWYYAFYQNEAIEKLTAMQIDQYIDHAKKQQLAWTQS